MGEIIPLEPRRRLKEILDRLDEALLDDDDLHPPEVYGWGAIELDDDGEPVRWVHPEYAAIIGYVPANPDLVFLDYRHVMRAYVLTIEELALGVEEGTLPDPVEVLDWRGQPI